MVEISVLVGFSLFMVQANVYLLLVPTIKSWFSVPNCGSQILVMSIENEIFLLIPCAFSKVVMWNPISILIVDSSPLEAFVFWNQ